MYAPPCQVRLARVATVHGWPRLPGAVLAVSSIEAAELVRAGVAQWVQPAPVHAPQRRRLQRRVRERQAVALAELGRHL
jgi:hypothetical protein